MKKTTILALVPVVLGVFTLNVSSADVRLEKVIASEHRTEQDKARDQYRHPLKTLEFFGLKPNMTVVEIWPGGGWYTEILAPYLKEKGQFIAAHFDPEAGDFYSKSLAKFDEHFVKNTERYGKIQLSQFNPPAKTKVAENNSVDMVLTFRNVHNWYMRGEKDGVQKAFEGFYAALKPGGILGVVDHRLPLGKDQEKEKNSGYMRQDLVVKWAEAAGFKLIESSEINANRKDKTNHPKGVWTLPPRLRLGEEDKAKYMAIGESDRMTLKFVKPAEK